MINNFSKKIVVGTAQFSKSYGVINNKTLSPINLLKISKKNYLNTFDTSDNYTKTFYFVGRNHKTSKLIVKVSTKKKNKSIPIILFKKKINEITNRISIKRIHSFLIHDFDLKQIKQNSPHYNYLMNYCLSKKIKFGFSIYNLKDFNKLKKNYKINILQIPLSIFNREFLDINFKNFVKKNKIEIHARSIFLQGLLVSDIKYIPNKFKKYKKYFINWDKYCQKNNLSKVQACLNFVYNIKIVKKIVIGFKSKKELEEIINFKRKKIKKFFLLPKIPKILINPNLWKNL